MLSCDTDCVQLQRHKHNLCVSRTNDRTSGQNYTSVCITSSFTGPHTPSVSPHTRLSVWQAMSHTQWPLCHRGRASSSAGFKGPHGTTDHVTLIDELKRPSRTREGGEKMRGVKNTGSTSAGGNRWFTLHHGCRFSSYVVLRCAGLERSSWSKGAWAGHG